MIHRLLTACLIVLTLAVALPQAVPLAQPVAAQDVQSQLPQITEEWRRTAERAEAAIDSGMADTVVFEDLRAELVEYRSIFLGAQSVNSARIETVRGQIEALGPAPAEGETESDDTAALRADLNEQLEGLLAPRRAAEQAYNRADGLIREIDRIIRERQAEELISVSPSPLLPGNWLTALEHVNSSVRGIGSETLINLGDEMQSTTFWRNLPVTLFYLIVGGLLLIRGRTWMEHLSIRMLDNTSVRRRVALSSFLSMGQVILPVIGIAALMEAARATDLAGPRGVVILDTVPLMGLALFGGFWLAGRSFPKAEHAVKPLNLSPARQRMGRTTSTWLAIVYALSLLLETVADSGNYPPEARSVTQFPLIIIGAFLVYRMGHLLRLHTRAERTSDEGRKYRDGLLDLMGRGCMAVAVVAPVAAAVGYRAMADAILFPAILTLALYSFVSTMQRFLSELYDSIFPHQPPEGDETIQEPLFPVLAGFLLSIAAMPILALIWGARTSDLTELWARFLAGFEVGGSRISPTNVLTFAIVFGIGFLVTRAFQGALRTSILPRTALDTGGRTAVTSGVGYVGIFIAALFAIGAAGLDLSSLAIVAGALSVGIGFGLQAIVSNFVSGIILLIERPISEGDWIEVGDKMGIVKSISVRSTRIQTFDRRDVIVPNSDFISGTVTNWTRGNLTGRVMVSVGVAYGTDTKRVEAILREICEAHPLVSMDPEPAILFKRFGADSLEFECYCILKNVNHINVVLSALNHEIARRFGEEGIEIPFAQRDIWLRNPEALHPAPAPRPSAPAPATPPREAMDLRDVAMEEGDPGEGDASPEANR